MLEKGSQPSPDWNAYQDPNLDSLPKANLWDVDDMYLWNGTWLPSRLIRQAIAFRSNFAARDTDIILASNIKCGTTWLKALSFFILRDQIGKEEDVLAKLNPHACVETLETMTYMRDPDPNLSGLPSPRLFHTHLHHGILPDSIKNSGCKIVYVARNPKDAFVSMWHHFNQLFRRNREAYPVERAFGEFCLSQSLYGPFFDHILPYWNESLRNPDRVLFLTYEDLKRNPIVQVKRLASFLGRPVENDDVAKEICWKCSLERLKDADVNKSGLSSWTGMPNSVFFRTGLVQGWKKYLRPEMEEHIDKITDEKLNGTGLHFDI